MTQLFNLRNTPSKEQARSRLLRSMARNAKRKLFQIKFFLFFSDGENLIPQVCWSCRASKGSNGDMNVCYVNVGHHAGWRNTIGLDSPWQHKPSFADLVGFNPLMLSLDLLHIWHLGLGREPCLICTRFLQYYVSGSKPVELLWDSCRFLCLRTFVLQPSSHSCKGISGMETPRKNSWQRPAGDWNGLRKTIGYLFSWKSLQRQI